MSKKTSETKTTARAACSDSLYSNMGRLSVGAEQALLHGLCLQLQYPAAQVGVVLLEVANHVSLSL